MNTTILMNPETFMHVQHMTGDLYEASPALPYSPGWTWRGVCISAPETITIKTQARDLKHAMLPSLPMCAAYMLGVPDLNYLCEAEFSLCDTNTQHIYNGKVSCQDGDRLFYPQMMSGDADPASARGGYAAWDLARYIALPVKATTYELTLTVGKTQSNTTAIAVFINEGPPID